MVVGAGQSGLNISEIANLKGFLPTEPSLGFTEMSFSSMSKNFDARGQNSNTVSS